MMLGGGSGAEGGSGMLKSSKTFLKLVGILIRDRARNGWRVLGKAEDLQVTYYF